LISENHSAASRDASVRTAAGTSPLISRSIAPAFASLNLDFGGARRHQRGADASARCGLLLLDRDVLVVQVGQ
jgi:hypothetical protein